MKCLFISVHVQFLNLSLVVALRSFEPSPIHHQDTTPCHPLNQPVKDMRSVLKKSAAEEWEDADVSYTSSIWNDRKRADLSFYPHRPY